MFGIACSPLSSLFMQKVPGKFNGDVGAELNLTGEGIEVYSCISETGSSDFTWVVTLHTDPYRNKGGIAVLVSGITDIVRVCTPAVNQR